MLEQTRAYPKLALSFVVSTAALTGCVVELIKTRLIDWVDKQPWRARMLPLQQGLMHNFGYSKASTSDERVVVDNYCFVIAICSHHLVVSMALAPAALLGWDAAGFIGQSLFYVGALGDVAFSVYDAAQITLRTFFPSSFRRLGVQVPVKYFVVMVCLHHTLSMMLTVPMLLYYPSMRAFHLIMCSQLLVGGISFLLGCYKVTLDTQHSRREFLQCKAIVLIQFLAICCTRGYLWVSQALDAMMVFYGQGDTAFLCVALVGFLLMSLFNLLTLLDSTKAVMKWLPMQMPPKGGRKLDCHERELKVISHEGMRRAQCASRVALTTQ
ncbi:unnamed protein product [Symbiodinium natans]|uniref:TLC domain-containing protein n=1 Tax=Symbiodinium natans TaxID=878477 RepID=A0A812UWG0_9DINO|nr:unnamed protein product [Symbiodinium natans]